MDMNLLLQPDIETLLDKYLQEIPNPELQSFAKIVQRKIRDKKVNRNFDTILRCQHCSQTFNKLCHIQNFTTLYMDVQTYPS